jgi:shikimate kinase
MKPRPIALIGLSGSGKSTIARLLGKELGWSYADTDALVEASAGCSIPHIFREQGEEAFRTLEAEALRQALAHDDPLVLATGGGIILRADNRALLQQHARVVWLDAPAAELLARLSRHNEHRPLLAGDMLVRLTELRQARAALYRATATLHLDTAALQPEAVARRIAAWAR